MSGLFQKILVPLDGTEIANQALPLAVELATKLNAQLLLIRIVPEARYEVGVKDIVPTYDLNSQKQRELVDHATRWLLRIEEDLVLRNVDAMSLVDVGDPAERILHYAAEEEAGLIVMSTHGRRGVPRLLHGSVAARVLGDSPCPVMLVHPKVAVGAAEAEELVAIA